MSTDTNTTPGPAPDPMPRYAAGPGNAAQPFHAAAAHGWRILPPAPDGTARAEHPGTSTSLEYQPEADTPAWTLTQSGPRRWRLLADDTTPAALITHLVSAVTSDPITELPPSQHVHSPAGWRSRRRTHGWHATYHDGHLRLDHHDEDLDDTWVIEAATEPSWQITASRLTPPALITGLLKAATGAEHSPHPITRPSRPAQSGA